jgi:hypothetical protein
MILKTVLERHGACVEGRQFAAQLTLREAWETCPRGDWLLWTVSELGIGPSAYCHALHSYDRARGDFACHLGNARSAYADGIDKGLLSAEFSAAREADLSLINEAETAGANAVRDAIPFSDVQKLFDAARNFAEMTVADT